MVDEKPLAKFRHPPLIEVVHGVQFAPLRMTIIHPGLFYAKVREKYPIPQAQPPLAPIREVFDGASPPFWPFGPFPGIELPRTWFVSADDTLLIQLQTDRLLLNWRRGGGNADYPHFEKVSEEFQRIYVELETFVAALGIGEIEPNQCEITYINHLDIETDKSGDIDVSRYLNILSLEQNNLLGPLEDMAFNLRFVIRDESNQPIGRLTANLGTFTTPDRQKQVHQLEFTARGAPRGQGLPAVIAFHQTAHRHIVNCFEGITTRSAQEKWERFQ